MSQKISIMKPDNKNTSHTYWKDMYYRANSSRKEGWRRYYSSDRSRWDILRSMKTSMANVEGREHIPTHIKEEYIKFISKFDEEKRECPICYEPMTVESAELTDCGHMFHAQCVEQHVNCPMCRRQRK